MNSDDCVQAMNLARRIDALAQDADVAVGLTAVHIAAELIRLRSNVAAGRASLLPAQDGPQSA